jgi:hypothetical protein
MRLGDAARPATADLVQALERRVADRHDPDDSERFYLVYLVRSVGNIGRAARAAAPTLEGALDIAADLPEVAELVRWAQEQCRDT